MKTISIYEATRRILGITKEELAAALGLSVMSIKMSNNGPTAIRTRKFVDELVNSFDDDSKAKIIELRDALYEVNMMSLFTRGRTTSISNFVIAMGYSYSSIAAELKVNEGDISRICRNSQHKSDDLEEKLTQWLDAKYSVMSANDQKRVDRRIEAIELTSSPNTNPFRKELLEKGLLATNDAKFRAKMETAISEAIGDKDKAIDELKEYVKLLEEENEVLRDSVEELKEENEALNNEKARKEKAMERMNDEIMGLNRELETHNTANAGLQDGVTDLNQRIDELEAEIFRLNEEKDKYEEWISDLTRQVEQYKAITGIKNTKVEIVPAPSDMFFDPASSINFYGNCTVNIYNGSRENSGT